MPSTWMLLMPVSLRPFVTFSAIAPTCRLARPEVTTMKSEKADLPRRSMVTVSSAFMSSRRERIIFRVLSASGCACKTTAGVDVLRFGKTDLDNTDVARDHFLSLYRERRIPAPADHTMQCGVNAFEIPEVPAFSS